MFKKKGYFCGEKFADEKNSLEYPSTDMLH